MAQDAVYEDVPRLRRRVGDNMLAGANNSAVLLGRDRIGTVDSGYGGSKGAGAIHLIVGRKAEDPSVTDDSATVYVSAKTDVDEVAGTSGIGQERRAVAGLVGRADCVRLSARRDFKVSVGRAYLTMDEDGTVTIEGDINLGEGAAQRLIRGDAFALEWANHVHPTAVGPSGTPVPLTQNVFSPRNKCR